MEKLIQDLRFALRMLLRDRTYAAVLIITLGLGIGACTTIFSVVNSILIRPLPYGDPERIALVWQTIPAKDVSQTSSSFPTFVDWRDQNKVFEKTAGAKYSIFNLTGLDEPERLEGFLVSHSFFSVLGVDPLMGRHFFESEEQPGAGNVAVLSHGIYQRRFGADPSVLGKTITLNEASYTIIGVMPPEFQFPIQGMFPMEVRPDVWVPLALDVNQSGRGSRSIITLARLKPGVSFRQAQADLEAIARWQEQTYPDSNAGLGVRITSMHDQVVGRVRPILLALLGAVVFVLLIACANVASLMLSKAIVRAREMAMRSALGASRIRLVRQLLTESLLISLLGGALGLLFAVWGVKLLVMVGPGNIPRLKQADVDGTVFLFVLAVSLMTGVVFGLAPAWRGVRIDLNETLKEGATSSVGGPRRHRLRSMFVVMEVALTLVLLAGAGLMIRSFLFLQQVDLGFDPRNVLTMQLTLPQSKYEEGAQQAAFYQQALQLIEGVQGVEQVGMVNALPLGGDIRTTGFSIEGRAPQSAADQSIANNRIVSPDYFRAMGIPLIKGRTLGEQDNINAPGAVLINEELSRQFFPGEDPLGKRISLSDQATGPWLTIVGVVKDTRGSGLDEDAEPELYFSYLQIPKNSMVIVARTSSAPLNFVSPIRTQIRQLDKDLPVHNSKTMQEYLSNAVAPWALNTVLLSGFAAVALVLAAVGIYGVMSYSVTQRTREIGLRMAMGARDRDILKLILWQGAKVTIAGLAIGMIGVFAVSGILSNLIYGISATDPLTFVSISVLLMLVALAACYLPARKAARLEPMKSLRYE